jgi:integrase
MTTKGIPSKFKGVPTSEVQQNLALAAQMKARGATFVEIAKHFKRSPESIRTWLKRHRALWEAAQDGALEKAAAEVATLAGSKAILGVPTKFMKAAEQADNWMREREGEPLFPDPAIGDLTVGADMTVPQFVLAYLIPNCLQDASAETRRLYVRVANKFALVMGNPRLRDISLEMLTLYRETLTKMIGRGKKKPLSINTVRMYLENLRIILDRAGPPGPRRRDAAGYLKIVPWVRLPREKLGEPRVITDEVLARCYAVADKMLVPKLKGVSPGAWWRALLVCGRYLGLRARTMFSLEFAHVQWDKRRLVLPAEIMKARKTLVLPMAAVVYEHLSAADFRTDRRFVFDYSSSREQFRVDFHKLQTIAEILPQNQFGLHILRKTAITRMWAKSPAAAQMLAGHGSPLITKLYYVATGEVINEAMDAVAAEPFMKG